MSDQLLVRYLLGQLEPEDTDRLDEASIVDDEIATRLRTVEHDLVDGYVRGTLTGETLTRFESHYLSSPRRRERVAFARKFVGAVDRAASSASAAASPAEASAELVSAPAAPRGWTASVWCRPSVLAIAAAFLLIVSGALLFQTVRLTRGLRLAQSDRVALDRRTRELEQQLADQRAVNTSGIKEPARLPPPATTAAIQPAPAIALLLLPQTRSIGALPTASVATGAASVGVELRLESVDFRRYQVGLRNPADNAIVWRSDWMAAKSSGGEASLRLAIPAAVLKPQHYSLDLIGQQPGGGSETVGSYAFEIIPR